MHKTLLAAGAALAALAGVDPSNDAVWTIVDRDQDAFVASVLAAGGVPERVLVHVQQAFAEVGAAPTLPAEGLAKLTVMERAGQLTATQAKDVLAAMLETGETDPEAVAKAKGYEAMDTGAVASAVDEAIAADPAAWSKYCAGEEKAAGALVGKVMKATRGQADGKLVNQIVREKLGG